MTAKTSNNRAASKRTLNYSMSVSQSQVAKPSTTAKHKRTHAQATYEPRHSTTSAGALVAKMLQCK